MTNPLDAVPGGVLTLSDNLRILAANAAVGELVGHPVEALIGQPFDVTLTAASRILLQTHVYPAIQAHGRVEEVFLTLAGSGGEPTPVLLNAVRRPDPGPAVYDALIVRILARARWEVDLLEATRGLERERTASQRLAADLERAAEDVAARHAEELRNREFRDAFAGVISHELRTPITTIYGMSHVLRRRHRAMDPETVEQHLGDIEEESDRLRRLTEDLLVLSRAETKIQVAADPIMIGHVVRAAVTAEQARAPSHAFAVDVGRAMPIVHGEALYIDQVVRNLIGNAIKYSPPATTIRVVVRSEQREEPTGSNEPGVTVRVIDEGPGLPMADPEVLFRLFYRDPAVIGKSSGAGIGLYVCRELIVAMGGRTWAVNRVDSHGAEFGFWLPASEEDEAD